MRPESKIVTGDCREALLTLPDCSVDAVVTDPPYHLTSGKKGGTGPASSSIKTPAGRARITTGFMGQAWDGGDIAHDPAMWAQCLRVLKPGGHLLAFGGTRTYHRMACAVEDAGFEIRDCIFWCYGNGFPKSLDVSKAIDRAAGAEREVIGFDASRARPNRLYDAGAIGNVGGAGRVSDRTDNGATMTAPATDAAKQWDGWGTALKPALEPIVVARKPMGVTVAQNVQVHGTGALNIDGCRIDASGRPAREIDPKASANGSVYAGRRVAGGGFDGGSRAVGTTDVGRWPANLVLDESAADELDRQAPAAGAFAPVRGTEPSAKTGDIYGHFDRTATHHHGDGLSGASRFFYVAKPSPTERAAGILSCARHVTVKPVALMRWLVRLVTPPGGLVLDPFCGSGTTLIAAGLEGFGWLGIEQDPKHAEIARQRVSHWLTLPRALLEPEALGPAVEPETGQIRLL